MVLAFLLLPFRWLHKSQGNCKTHLLSMTLHGPGQPQNLQHPYELTLRVNVTETLEDFSSSTGQKRSATKSSGKEHTRAPLEEEQKTMGLDQPHPEDINVQHHLSGPDLESPGEDKARRTKQHMKGYEG